MDGLGLGVDISDVTKNLVSLQFESTLSKDESQFLVLRKRSHAMTVTACAQATYFVSILNEARQIAVHLKNPSKYRASNILQDNTPNDPLIVGIIGSGRLGSQLASCFLSFSGVNPEQLKISTRRPENLTDLRRKGVSCLNDNLAVATCAHLLFICVLPSQLPCVADDIRGHIPLSCTVYSFVLATPMPRLRDLLQVTNIIRPQFEWTEEGGANHWDCTLDVKASFAVLNILKLTCPLYYNKKEMIIETSEKFTEQMVYALVNLCTSFNLKRTDVVDIVNALILGDSNTLDAGTKIKEEDITHRLPLLQNLFPKFDLSAVIEKDTPLTRKLVKNPATREAHVKHYAAVFKQYIHWNSSTLLLRWRYTK